MTEFATWEFLGTNAGAVAMVLLIVQFIKAPLDKVWKIPTRALVYALALVILLAADAILHTLTWESVTLCLFNAVVVSAGSMGAYEMTFAKLDEKKEIEEP